MGKGEGGELTIDIIIVSRGLIFFSSRRRHTRYWRDWSSDVCSSDLASGELLEHGRPRPRDGRRDAADRRPGRRLGRQPVRAREARLMRAAAGLLAAFAVATTLALATAARAASAAWCGAGEPTTEVADTVSAFEWHVVYALPDGGVDAPTCANEYGRIDISLVHVPAGVTTFAGITGAVRAAGFEDPDKGYLVYFDGSPHIGTVFGVCGEGGVDDVAFAYAIVFLQT